MKVFDMTGKTAIVTGGNGGIGLGRRKGLPRAAHMFIGKAGDLRIESQLSMEKWSNPRTSRGRLTCLIEPLENPWTAKRPAAARKVEHHVRRRWTPRLP
jgi:hypothetical protein